MNNNPIDRLSHAADAIMRGEMRPEETASFSYSQRAMIGAYLERLVDEKAKENKRRKKEWIKAARAAFQPTEQQDCEVCGKYKSATHAHHVLPLSLQYDLGVTQPDHSYIWLCPTHHYAIHIDISALIKNVGVSLPGFPPEERDRISSINVRFVEKYCSWRYGNND